MVYEYEHEISSLIIDNPSEIDGYAYDEIKEVYRKAKMYDEHTCDEPVDVNINIKLTKKSLEDLNWKDLNHTVKAKLDRNGGLL